MTIDLLTAFVLALLVSTAFGKYYIPWLKKQHVGQEIYKDLILKIVDQVRWKVKKKIYLKIIMRIP